MIYGEIALNVASKQRLVFWKLSRVSKSRRHVTDRRSVFPLWIRASTETHEILHCPQPPSKDLYGLFV